MEKMDTESTTSGSQTNGVENIEKGGSLSEGNSLRSGNDDTFLIKQSKKFKPEKRKPEGSPELGDTIGAEHEYAGCLRDLFTEIYSMKNPAETVPDIYPRVERAMQLAEQQSPKRPTRHHG
uniref:Uncharacterized protein n=1 Tax=Cacopsylla melanoneura TaxID=428564 RepID=A0A8D8QV12_9HEMI